MGSDRPLARVLDDLGTPPAGAERLAALRAAAVAGATSSVHQPPPPSAPLDEQPRSRPEEPS